MKNNWYIKCLVFVMLVLLIGTIMLPNISGYNKSNNKELSHNSNNAIMHTKDTIINFNEGSLSGYVTDTYMDPIAGARVRVSFHGTYEEDYTDSEGYYYVSNIPICYCLKNTTASKQGYYPEWVLLSITENTTYDFILTQIPGPDLECEGELAFEDIELGETYTGSFEVFNVGTPESELNWEIESYPDWGTWYFNPVEGSGLTPEDGPIVVEVEFTAPDESFEPYGEIIVVNTDDPDDTCLVPITCPYFPRAYSQRTFIIK